MNDIKDFALDKSITVTSNSKIFLLLSLFLALIKLFIFIGVLQTGRADLLIAVIICLILNFIFLRCFFIKNILIQADFNNKKIIFYKGSFFKNSLIGELPFNLIKSARFEQVRFGEYFSKCVIFMMKDVDLSASFTPKFKKILIKKAVKSKYSKVFPKELCWPLNLPQMDRLSVFLLELNNYLKR